MKALIAVFADGERHMLKVVHKNFDTQKWANSKIKYFNLLQIIKIIEHYAE